jgi:hypothetical protein
MNRILLSFLDVNTESDFDDEDYPIYNRLVFNHSFEDSWTFYKDNQLIVLAYTPICILK